MQYITDIQKPVAMVKIHGNKVIPEIKGNYGVQFLSIYIIR